MKQLLILAIFPSLIMTSCTDIKNLAEPEKDTETEELYTTREYEVDGTTYIDYINSRGVIKFTVGGDLGSNLSHKK